MNPSQFLSASISFFLIFTQALHSANLTVDTAAPSANQAGLITAPNGVPVVNIVTPNTQGLSHNKFSTFNVEQQGLVLNNAKSIANTQLAGYIAYNPNLTGNAASLILNEVTGTSKTLLRGYTEVAGQAADVIVANPNGISINGGGFINTPNATLTTGTPLMHGAMLQGFDVERGVITVDGDGFNAHNIARVNLYAKALEFNAKLYADELNVIAGENSITLEGTHASKNKSGTGVAIDSTLLGGIYANAITLKSTDKGIGVHLPPEILAQSSLELNADGDIVASKIIAGTAVTLNSHSADATLKGDISAQNISIDAAKKLLIEEDSIIEATDTLVFKAENMHNKGELIALEGTGKSTFYALNNINNEGLMGGYDLDIDASDVENTGALYTKNDLTLKATNLNNVGLIHSNNAIDLLIADTFTNQEEGVIYSDGSLNIASNSDKDKINTVTNHGLIQSEKDIVITAKTLNNTAPLPTFKNISSTTTKTVSKGGSNDYDVIVTTTHEQIIDTPTNPALILASDNISLDVDTLNNVYSLIASDKNIHLNATQVSNVGKVIVNTTTTKTTQYRDEKYCSSSGPSGVCFSHKHRAAYRGTFTTTSTSRQPLINYGIQAKHSITGNVITLNNISDQLTGSLSDQQILSKLTTIESIENGVFSLQKLTLDLQTSDETVLSSLNTDETLLSQIATQEDLTYFKDDLTILKQTIQTAITENQATLESLENTLNSIKHLNILQDTSELENAISLIKDNIAHIDEHIASYETLNGNLVTVEDLENNKQNLLDLNESLKNLFSQNLQTLTSLDATALNQKLEQTSNALRDEVNVALALNENIEYKIITSDEGLYQTNTHNALAQTQSVTPTTSSGTIIDNITLPKGKYGLFLANQASDHPYLIEANPLFTNYNTFISSDYMLSKLDYRPEHTLKRLGDAMFETQLVSSSVLLLSGGRYLEGYASELEQFQALMDNALSLQTSLDLHVGISLSKEQVAQLGKNIVWMVEREVEGHRVLVPEVYLASTNISSDGAKIAAGEIDLVIQDTLLNEGLIASEGTLAIVTGAKLTNHNGSITSGEEMLLASGGVLENLSGTLASGGDMQLIAQSISSRALSEDKTYTYAQGYQTTTQKGKAAQLVSGGNAHMEANEDITLANTNVKAMEDIVLSSTEGTVSIEALETRETYAFGIRGDYNRGESITNHASSIEAKNIAITANQVNVIASSLDAQENILLEGKERVNILAANDATYQDTMVKTKGGLFGGKRVQQDTLYKETVVQSTLDANNILIHSSDGEILLEAANLVAKENILMDAKEDITVLAKQYKEGELHSVKKSSWGGLSKSASMNRVDALNAQEAHLRTEALNIIMKSGKDIRVIGSNLDAASDLQLHAANEVLIAAAQEFSKHEQWSKKSSFNLGNLIASLATLGLADTGPVYAMELQHDQQAATSAKASSLKSGGGLYIESGNTKILGSSLEAHDALHITASKGDIEILAAQETAQTSSHFEKKELRLASIVEVAQALNPKLPGEDTKLKITLAEATYDKEVLSTQGLTHKSASLKSEQGNIHLNAQENIHVQGSTLTAQEDIRLATQEGDVTITESIDIFSKDSQEKHASATISLTVQNEYVEIGSAVKAAAESAKQLKKVKDDYNNYKNEVGKLEAILGDLTVRYRAKEAGIDYEDIEDLRELIDHIKDNEKYYVAAIAAASADLASKTVAIAAQVATAAASSGTWGFSIGLALDLKGESLLEKAGITHPLASTFFAQNISIATGAHHDTTLSGSALVAKENLDITTHNLHVNASADTTTSNQESKDLSASLSVTMYGGGSGLGASLGYGQGHHSSQSTTHTNAELLAQNITIETTNDASFKGATVKADESLNINVKGDLSVESVRDSSASNAKGFNVSLSGSSSGSAGASYGASTGTTQSKQTVLTSLTGEHVTVDVEGNTHVKGALIAAGKTNKQGTFEDNGNLNLTTNTLTFANSTDSMYSSSNSFTAGTNIGFGTKTNTGTTVEETTGKVNSSTLSLANHLGYSSAKTLATIGEGTLHVKDTENSDELERLNRDTTKVSKELYEGNVGTSVSATLDHRLLSEEGRKEIAEDFLKTGMMVDIIQQIATNETVGITDFFHETEKHNTTYEAIKKRIAQDKDLSAVLNSPAYTDEQKNAILNEITQHVMVELGYKPIETLLIATTEPGRDGEQVKGYYSLETGRAYVNALYNTNNQALLLTAGTEAQRAMDAQNGSNFDQSQEYRDARSVYSENFGSSIVSYTDFALYFTGQGSVSTAPHLTSTPAQVTLTPSVFNNDIANNTIEFVGLNKELGDNLTIFVHGTFSSPKDADKDFLNSVSNTHNEPVYQFDWSGKGGTAEGEGAENSAQARAYAAWRLAQYIENYTFKEGEPLNIIAHSHGGNVFKDFTQFYEGTKKIDTVVLMGTPVRDDHFIDYSKFDENAKIINVYDTSDVVQAIGSINGVKSYLLNKYTLGLASRVIPNENINNIKIEVPNNNWYDGLIGDHVNMDSEAVWEMIKNEVQ